MDVRASETATSGDGSTQDAAPKTQPSSGLKKIKRLISDDRLSRIHPTADYSTVIEYYSLFAREFIRAHYNFCAAKMTVAREGKATAIDEQFRESEKWMANAIAWTLKFQHYRLPLVAEKITVKIPIPNAARLVALINDYDTFFVNISAAAFAGSITSDVRDKSLANVSRRVMALHTICVPDNDQYDLDGSLLNPPKP